jgi:hypothetical protein
MSEYLPGPWAQGNPRPWFGLGHGLKPAFCAFLPCALGCPFVRSWVLFYSEQKDSNNQAAAATAAAVGQDVQMHDQTLTSF